MQARRHLLVLLTIAIYLRDASSAAVSRRGQEEHSIPEEHLQNEFLTRINVARKEPDSKGARNNMEGEAWKETENELKNKSDPRVEMEGRGVVDLRNRQDWMAKDKAWEVVEGGNDEERKEAFLSVEESQVSCLSAEECKETFLSVEESQKAFLSGEESKEGKDKTRVPSLPEHRYPAPATPEEDNEGSQLVQQGEAREDLCVAPEDIWPCECHATGTSVEIWCFGVASAAMIDRALSPEYPYSNLTRLFSMYSALGHLHKDILHGKTFEVLDLTSSSIETVEAGAFAGCRARLNSLMLTTNSLKYFPFKDLPQYPRLESLSLAGNQLTSLDELVGLPELPLTVLYLGNNLISSLHPQSFASVPHLSILEINTNNLTSIPPQVFMPLTQLQILYLYKNNIKHLATGSLWFSTPILRALDVRGNHIEVVEEDVFRGVDYSSQVNLDNNNFRHMQYDVFAPLLKNVSTQYGWLSIMWTRLECDCDVLWIVSRADYMDHLLFGSCSNRTSLENLDVQALADFCATGPLLQDSYEEEEMDTREYDDINGGGVVEYGVSYGGVNGWWWPW